MSSIRKSENDIYCIIANNLKSLLNKAFIHHSFNIYTSLLNALVFVFLLKWCQSTRVIISSLLNKGIYSNASSNIFKLFHNCFLVVLKANMVLYIVYLILSNIIHKFIVYTNDWQNWNTAITRPFERCNESHAFWICSIPDWWSWKRYLRKAVLRESELYRILWNRYPQENTLAYLSYQSDQGKKYWICILE